MYIATWKEIEIWMKNFNEKYDTNKHHTINNQFSLTCEIYDVKRHRITIMIRYYLFFPSVQLNMQ